MKNSWNTLTLGEICEVLDSRRIPITKRNRIPGPYPYYGATGILDYVNNYIFNEKLILIGEDGAKWGSGDNTAFIVEGKFWVNNHAHVIRPDRSKFLDEWIVYYLNFSDLTKYTTGLTVPKLNQTKLKEILIPAAPLAEQRRIVAILDEAFAAIDNAKKNTLKNLQNSRELFESYLNNVIDSNNKQCKWKKLIDLSEIKYGYTKKASDKNIGPKFLRITDIQNNKVNWDFVPYCEINKKDYQKYKLLDGDIVFARTGATTGKSCLIKNPPCSVYASYLIRLRIYDKKLLHPEFLSHFFQSQYYWDFIISGVSGSAQGGFNANKLGNLDIPLPSFYEQQKIINQFNALKKDSIELEALYEKKLATLLELEQSILTKAFSGEL